jgi:hypothetical protein
MFDPQQSLAIVVPGRIHIYIYIHIHSEPLSAQDGFDVEFIMKRAKLQYAIKASTRLNDGEQCVGGAFSHRCNTRPRLRQDPLKTHAVACSLPQLH